MKNYTINASKKDWSAYWLGANYTNPNDSFSGTNGDPINWGTKEQCELEIEEAKRFCAKRGLEGIEFYLSEWTLEESEIGE